MAKRGDSVGQSAVNALAAFAGEKLPATMRAPGEAQLTEAPFGDVRVYYNGATGHLASMIAGSVQLKPGMSPHPPHQHPEEEIMLVAAGTGEILVDGKTMPAAPGSMMYCAGGKMHTIANTGNSPLLFYYFKWKR